MMDINKIFNLELAALTGGSAPSVIFYFKENKKVELRKGYNKDGSPNGTIFVKVFGKSLCSLQLLADIGGQIQGYTILVSSDKKFNIPLLILNPLPAAKEVALDE